MLGRLHHLLEGLPTLRLRAGDGIVDVVADYMEAMLDRVAVDGTFLVGDALLLLLGGAAEIADGGGQPIE